MPSLILEMFEPRWLTTVFEPCQTFHEGLYKKHSWPFAKIGRSIGPISTPPFQ